MKREIIAITTLLLVFTLFGVLSSAEPYCMVTSDITHHDNFSMELESNTWDYKPLYGMTEGDGIYGEFRIITGNDIYFFIVDQDGHDTIQSDQAAQNPYKAEVYERENLKWHYWNFTLSHDGHWYVYFSKSTSVQGVTSESARIEGSINEDTSAPDISVNQPEGPIIWETTISFETEDLGFPIKQVDIYIDDILLTVIDNPNKQSGRILEGEFSVSSWGLDNGNHTIVIHSWDLLDNHSSYIFIVETRNPIKANLILIAAIGIVAFLAIAYCSLKRNQ